MHPFDKKWTYPEGPEKENLIRLINKNLDSEAMKIGPAMDETVRTRELSFYSKAFLTAWDNLHSVPVVTFEYLVTENQGVFTFGGTHDSLLEIAGPAGIHLTRENVLDYTRFYLDHVWTEEDGFKLVRSFRDIEFTGDISPLKLTQLKVKLFPPKIKSPREKNNEEIQGQKRTENGAKEPFILIAPILYADNLYRTLIEVKPTGELSIIEEKHLLKNVPTRTIFLE